MKCNFRLKYLVMPLSIIICFSANYINAMDKNDSGDINMFIEGYSYGERILNIMAVINNVDDHEKYLTNEQIKNFDMLCEKFANSENNEDVSLNKYQVKALEDLEEVCYSNPEFINMNNCTIV